MRKWVLLLILIAPSAIAQDWGTQALIHQNPCSWPEVQSQLMAAWNHNPVFLKGHGKIVKMSHLTTKYISDVENDIGCFGSYSFEDGTTRTMEFSAPMDLNQMGSR